MHLSAWPWVKMVASCAYFRYGNLAEDKKWNENGEISFAVQRLMFATKNI